MEESTGKGMSARAGVLVGVGAGSVVTLVLVVLATVVILLVQVRAEVEGLRTRCEYFPLDVGQASLREYEAATQRLEAAASAAALEGDQGCVKPEAVGPKASAGETTGSMSAAQWLQSAGQ